MVIPDVNVLVNAFRPELPDHQASAGWLQEQINGPSVFGISDRVLEGFIRVVTHPGIFKQPDPLEDAIAFIEVLISRENCVRVRSNERQWTLFLRMIKQVGAEGNSVSDAWLAALAIEAGAEWVTWDRGFARYPGLKWSLPKAPR